MKRKTLLMLATFGVGRSVDAENVSTSYGQAGYHGPDDSESLADFDVDADVAQPRPKPQEVRISIGSGSGSVSIPVEQVGGKDHDVEPIR